MRAVSKSKSPVKKFKNKSIKNKSTKKTIEKSRKKSIEKSTVLSKQTALLDELDKVLNKVIN